MTITEQMAEALKPFAEACTNAEISGYPPGNFVDASAYEKARAALIAASAASPKGEPVIWWKTHVNGRLTDATDIEHVASIWREQGFILREAFAHPAPLRSPQGGDGGADLARCRLRVCQEKQECIKPFGQCLTHLLPGASFQAGAEAMREAAAKVCQRWLDNYSNLAIDYSTPREYATGAVLDIKEVIEALPIPASPEGR